MSESQSTDQVAIDKEDVATLATWCARSSESYNTGVIQTCILLNRAMLSAVAAELDAMDIPTDRPAHIAWSPFFRPGKSDAPDA